MPTIQPLTTVSLVRN